MGGICKLKIHEEDKVHKIISKVGDNGVHYKNIEGEKKWIVHRNILIYCDELLGTVSRLLLELGRYENKPRRKDCKKDKKEQFQTKN